MNAATIVDGKEYIYIARDTIIENAIGGAGNDNIIGNDAKNKLEGGDGNDVLDGGLGRDTLEGGEDNDQLYGGEGSDALRGGDGFDTYFIGEDEDRDVITDSDGVGVIRYQLDSGALVDIIGEASYSNNKRWTLDVTDTQGQLQQFILDEKGDDLRIVNRADTNDEIWIRDFEQSGDIWENAALGITLENPDEDGDGENDGDGSGDADGDPNNNGYDDPYNEDLYPIGSLSDDDGDGLDDTILGDVDPTLPQATDDAISDINDWFSRAVNPGPTDPLVIDLDGDGVEVSRTNRVQFDIDGDAADEAIGWITGDDGFLVRDINGNGVVDGIAELYGNPAQLGYVELREDEAANDNVPMIDSVRAA